MKADIKTLTIRPETHKDYKDIVSLVLRSFKEGTDYSDGTDIVALIEEIRDSDYYIPELAFVAELDGKIVGHFLFSRFPLSETPCGGHGGANDTDIVMLAPVSVHADYLRQGIGSAMIKLYDKAAMLITTGTDIARTGEIFCEDPIEPDVQSADSEADAVKWILGY